MDEVRNPFAPGAGNQPPALLGRDKIITSADISLQRALLGKHTKSQMLLGLRGTGKTVLLNKIEQMASDHKHQTSFIEAPEDKALVDLLYPKIQQVLRKLSFVEGARAQTHKAMRALRGFASAFKIQIGDLSLSVDPEPGVADSGHLEFDLSDLFLGVGEAARSAGVAWTLLIDEVQYLKNEELSALIVAIHRSNQKQLPVLFFGAGLPQIAGLSGDAKSYAERLFDYPAIGPLAEDAAMKVIRQPVEDEGEEITDQALEAIIEDTRAYPYFLQEWGYQAWNLAEASPISVDLIKAARASALNRLDEGFFTVRFDRLTPKEREYVVAMAQLGDGPYRSSDVADYLEERAQSLGPRRSKIIHKGMIYSPSYGDIAFTVPMFADYLRRKHPVTS